MRFNNHTILVLLDPGLYLQMHDELFKKRDQGGDLLRPPERDRVLVRPQPAGEQPLEG